MFCGKCGKDFELVELPFCQKIHPVCGKSRWQSVYVDWLCKVAKTAKVPPRVWKNALLQTFLTTKTAWQWATVAKQVCH